MSQPQVPVWLARSPSLECLWLLAEAARLYVEPPVPSGPALALAPPRSCGQGLPHGAPGWRLAVRPAGRARPQPRTVPETVAPGLWSWPALKALLQPLLQPAPAVDWARTP